MCFLCKCKPKPGSLSLEKCLKLGVPKGPLLGKLKNGETITTENGTTVRPEDVREPDDPGPTFLGTFLCNYKLRNSRTIMLKHFTNSSG